MRRVRIGLVTGVFTLSVLAGGAASAPPAAASVTKVVKMTSSLRFMPKVITIHQGDRIEWKNASTGIHHTTKSNTGLWNSGDLAPGQTFTRRFGNVGTFRYHCRYHRSSGMVGKIVVQA